MRARTHTHTRTNTNQGLHFLHHQSNLENCCPHEEGSPVLKHFFLNPFSGSNREIKLPCLQLVLEILLFHPRKGPGLRESPGPGAVSEHRPLPALSTICPSLLTWGKRTPGQQLVQGHTTSNQNLNRPSDSMPAPCPLECTSPQVKALKKTPKEVKFMFKKRLIPSILNLRK